MGFGRGLHPPAANDPIGVPVSGPVMAVNARYLQNTLEQLVLFLVAIAALSLELPANRLSYVPAYSVLFVVGRILFWIGYHIKPIFRAPGFGLTLLPTVAALSFLAYRAFFSIFYHNSL